MNRSLHRLSKQVRLANIEKEKRNSPPNPFEEVGGLLDRAYLEVRKWMPGGSVKVSARGTYPKEVAYVVEKLRGDGWTVKEREERMDSTSFENHLIIS